MMTLDDFFACLERPRPLFDALAGAIETSEPVHQRVTKSRVAFRDETGG